MNEWSETFDRIWCIHYVKNIERTERIIREFDRVGIIDSGVFSWFYDWDSPYFKLIQHGITPDPASHDIHLDSQYKQFKCSFSHYRCIKESYETGLNRVLITEDDIVFLKDTSMLNEMVHGSTAFDLCLFDKFSCSRAFLNSHRPMTTQWEFRKFSQRDRLISGGCYSLSRTGMAALITAYENMFVAADQVWNTNTPAISEISKACCMPNAACQDVYATTNCQKFDFNLAYSLVGLDRKLYQGY